jgi:hypothetical protein
MANRWMIRASIIFVSLTGVNLAVYLLAYQERGIAWPIIRDVLAMISAPTAVVLLALFAIGPHVSPLLYRVAALILLLAVALPAIFADALVLFTQLTSQVLLAVVLPHWQHQTAVDD